MNKGRKTTSKSRKRKLAIKQLWKKYGDNIAILDIKKYLEKDYGIITSRQQIYLDVKFLGENELNEESEENRNLLLEVTYDELKIQYREARDNYDTSDEKLDWSKRMTDISKLKHTVEKELDELRMQNEKATQNNITYNVSIGKPRTLSKADIEKIKRDKDE